MKQKTVYIILLLMLVNLFWYFEVPSACASSSIAHSQYLILPKEKQSALFETKNGELHVVRLLPFPPLAKITQGSMGWIAGISKKGDRISVVICSKFGAGETRTLDLPKSFRPHSMTFVGDTLFVGGGEMYGNEILGFYDLNKKNPKWNTIEVPDIVKKYGKTIDALLVTNDRLIAVDNVLLPKWLLVYDITRFTHPWLIQVRRLRWHGTYEHVRLAAIGGNWIAIISGTGSMTGPGQHLSLLDRSCLDERAALSTRPIPNDLPSDPWPGKYDWSDVAFLNDLLLVAAGNDGIGLLDLSNMKKAGRIDELCRASFSFVSLPRFGDRKILRVLPTNSSGLLAVVVEKDSILQSLLVDAQELLGIARAGGAKSFKFVYERGQKYWKDKLKRR